MTTADGFHGTLHYVAEAGHEDSIATLVDETRSLLTEAVEHGWTPDALVVESRLYDLISRVKSAEIAVGRPVTVLGLRLERAG